ncbi:hypothetical protein TNCV_1767201 [Trichonephila clavipes]|nr:hypothetical protein TNCV_1767201 [Trichonephila clavipes]
MMDRCLETKVIHKPATNRLTFKLANTRALSHDRFNVKQDLQWHHGLNYDNQEFVIMTTKVLSAQGVYIRLSTDDEAHFWLNGYVNKQNCRIWSEANPQVYVETPLHPEKLTVWGALWAGGILLQKR